MKTTNRLAIELEREPQHSLYWSASPLAQSRKRGGVRPSDRTVHTVGLDARPRVISTLSEAFHGEPVLGWLITDDARRARVLPEMFDWLFDEHLWRGMIQASPGGEVATMWRTPGNIHNDDPLTVLLALRLVRIFGLGIARGAKVAATIGKHVPKGEDWMHLRYVGVRRELQGQGWGSLAIRTGIAEADRRGVGTCLETATPANVGIYRGLGFEVVDRWNVCNGGPKFWTMVRPVQRASARRDLTGSGVLSTVERFDKGKVVPSGITHRN